MLRLFAAFILCLIVSSNSFASVNNITEEDGSPSIYPWKLKVSNGTLTDNGDGSASLTTGGGGGGGTPGGSDTEVQFNDGGSFGGDSGLTYNKTTDALTAAGNITGAIVQSRRASGFTNFSWYSTTNVAEEWLSYLNGEDVRFYEAGGGGDRVTFEKGGNVGVGITDPVHLLSLSKTIPTALGTPYLAIGGTEYNASGIQTIGFGYTDGTRIAPPIEIGYVTTNTTGGTFGDFIIGTRSVSSNTAVTERVRVKSTGETILGDSTNNSTASTTGITFAGTARPTASLYFSSTAGTCRTDNGCTDSAKYETSTNKVNYFAASFAADADDFWQTSVKLPANYDGGTFTARAVWTGTTEASATVVWGIQGFCLSDDDALDTAFGTAQTVSDDVTVTGDYQVTSESSAITFGSSCTAGDQAIIQVYRDPDNGSDDATNPALLIGVYLTYTKTQISTGD